MGKKPARGMSKRNLHPPTPAPSVRRFVRELAHGSKQTTMEIDGRTYRLLAMPELTEDEKTTMLMRGKELLAQAHQNARKFPATELRRRVRTAIREVRKQP